MTSVVRPLSRMVTRPQPTQLLRQSPYFLATSQFHSSTHRNATPYGEPPKGFRLPRPKRFDEGESIMDKASNYFLLTEMFRGMYVVMEQFFRPPYASRPTSTSSFKPAESHTLDIQSTTPSRKAPSRLGSVANMRSAATPRAKNAASHASSAKPSAPLKPSPLKPRKEKMVREERHDTTST